MFYLVTGGSGSGKSSFAEETICQMKDRTGASHLYYIATMYPYGSEMEKKIERHRKMREGKGFQTIECYQHISEILKNSQWFTKEKQEQGICVLLECMSNLVANELFLEEKHSSLQDAIASRIGEEIAELSNRCVGVVVVTNEVFSDSLAYTSEMEEYRRVLGEINQTMARTAEKVSEIVYGIEVKIKG